MNPFGWLMLGVFALPLAAGLFILAQWLGPHLLEPVPESASLDATPMRPRPRSRWALTKRQLAIVRAGAAMLVLALIAFGVSRWPASRSAERAAPAVSPAAEVQLPPPVSLRVTTRTGSVGSGAGQLADPRDVAVDQAGNVYVADTGNKRVVKFKPDGSFISAWTTAAQGTLAEPSSIVAVKDGIVVCDSETAQLHKYDFEGKPLAGFEHDLALSHPRGIAAAPGGTIYIGDTANNRILRVGPDGAPRGDFETKGTKLEQPTGVVTDEQGAVYSIEPAANRIQKFSADGALHANLYVPGAVTPLPPRGAWIPGRGLVVTLPNQNLLLTYDSAGAPEATFAPEGPPPVRPLGLAVVPDKQSVWVVWNADSLLTQMLWP